MHTFWLNGDGSCGAGLPSASSSWIHDDHQTTIGYMPQPNHDDHQTTIGSVPDPN